MARSTGKLWAMEHGLWVKQGVWEQIYQSVLESAERGSNVEFAAILEIDSTTCKAHQHAAGGKGGDKKTTLRTDQEAEVGRN